jgi:hypothetical protein
MTDEMLAALREVDALTPGSPPLYKPPAPPPRRFALPRGWRYEEQTDVYVDPRGQRTEGEYIRAMADPQRWFAAQARDLADILDIAARQP